MKIIKLGGNVIKNGIELKTEKINFGDKVRVEPGKLYEYPGFVFRFFGSIPEDVDAGNGHIMRRSKMAYGVLTEDIDKIMYLTHDGLLPDLAFKVKGQTYVYDHDTLVKAEDFDGQLAYIQDLDI